MKLRDDIINKILSNIQVSLLVSKFSARDEEYEYILDGIGFNSVVVGELPERKELDVYDKRLARFFVYDFIDNATSQEQGEFIFLHHLKEQFILIFENADEKGYNEFNKIVEDRIKPYQNTDVRVTQTIWKLLNQYMYIEKEEIIQLDSDYISAMGYKNGCIRKAAEIISMHPDMFFQYPGLLIKHKAINHSRSYYFNDAFWSVSAYREAVKQLAGEYLSEDGQTWIYRQKGNKTAFIALFEELYVKDYLKKRLTNQEIKNIALNSFGIDISERTFNEGAVIIKAQNLFKFIPVHKRYIGEDEETYNEIYKRR